MSFLLLVAAMFSMLFALSAPPLNMRFGVRVRGRKEEQQRLKSNIYSHRHLGDTTRARLTNRVGIGNGIAGRAVMILNGWMHDFSLSLLRIYDN